MSDRMFTLAIIAAISISIPLLLVAAVVVTRDHALPAACTL